MKAKKAPTPRSRARKAERVSTPFGRVALGCAKPEQMDRETLATLERGLTHAAKIHHRRGGYVTE